MSMSTHNYKGELNHAGALRTTYAREAKYGLNKDVHFKRQDRWGRLPVVVYFGDHLQLPLVQASSSMLAPLKGTTNEHKVGAKIFRDAELVFEFQQAMRFTDHTLIDTVNTMRVAGGRALTEQQWQALENTQVSAEQPDIPASWYHSCYCWSVISMAAFMLARRSARPPARPLNRIILLHISLLALLYTVRLSHSRAHHSAHAKRDTICETVYTALRSGLPHGHAHTIK